MTSIASSSCPSMTTPTLRPDWKLDAHPTRPSSVPTSRIRRRRQSLATLGKTAATSMQSAPVVFSLQVFWTIQTMVATALVAGPLSPGPKPARV